MRRSACTWATSRPRPSAPRMSGFAAQHAHQLGQHVVGFQEPLRPAALVGEFRGRLLPRAVHFAQHVVVGHERVLEHHLVEIVLSRHLVDRVDGDARRLHVDQELRQPVPAVFLGGGRRAEQADHVVGVVGVAGPHLGAVDEPAAVGLGGLGAGREQVGARIGLAHADGEAHLAAADARQHVGLHALAAVPDQHRPALPVGDEMQAHRRIGDPEFLGDDVAFQEAALPAAELLGPGHADPALGADLAAELLAVAVIVAGLVRIEGAGRDLLGQERAHLAAQAPCIREAGGPDRMSAPLPSPSTSPPASATAHRRRWRPRDCRASPPRSFRCRNRRATPTAAA